MVSLSPLTMSKEEEGISIKLHKSVMAVLPSIT